jgi:sugar/nucleoside kinase (ribokinase family)
MFALEPHVPSSHPRLLVLGPQLVDRLRFPGGAVEERPGGNGLVVAAVAARLGWPTALVTRLARDATGQRLEAFLLGQGVLLHRQEPPAGLGSKRAEIRVDAAGRWTTESTSPARYPYIAAPTGAESTPGCLLLTGLCSLLRCCPEATRAWLALARAQGAAIGFGLNRLEASEGPTVDALLGPDDALFCNAEELVAWRGLPSGERAVLAAALAAAPGGDLVVSLGAEGLLLRPRGGSVTHQPGHPGPVCSSLGAGDVLCAVTTVQRLRGEPLDRAAALGQRAAARSLRDTSWWAWLDDEPELVEALSQA